MRLVLLVLVVAACGGPPAPRPVPVTNAQPVVAAAPAPVEPVESVATRLAKAGFAGDRATAMSLTLTFEQLDTYTVAAQNHPKERWDEEVTDYFDHLEREGREHDSSVNIVGATIVKEGTLKASPGERIKRDVDFAFVQLQITKDGGEPKPGGMPMLFLKTGVGWRFSPKK